MLVPYNMSGIFSSGPQPLLSFHGTTWDSAFMAGQSCYLLCKSLLTPWKDGTSWGVGPCDSSWPMKKERSDVCCIDGLYRIPMPGPQSSLCSCGCAFTTIGGDFCSITWDSGSP